MIPRSTRNFALFTVIDFSPFSLGYKSDVKPADAADVSFLGWFFF